MANLYTGLGAALLWLVALIWVVQGIRSWRGLRQLPNLGDVDVAATPLPAVSVLVPARDEAENLVAALPTLLSQDHPDYQVVVIDDRSRDATGEVLEEFSRQHPLLEALRVTELPPGWLGKSHALHRAYQEARGDWLVFSDADARFGPDLLRRAVSLALEKNWDHLTLLSDFDLEGFWEKAVMSYFVLGFALQVEPWRVHDPSSNRYMGVGTFQLVSRSAYRTIGTHGRLALEVVDDMKLGKLIKQAGLRSGVAVAEGRLRIRWQKGLRNLILGTTKNFFAVADFRVSRVSGQLLGCFLVSLLPYLVLFSAGGTLRLAAAVAVAASLGFHLGVTSTLRLSPLYVLSHPLGALILIYMSVVSQR